jgi:hypothetical protein
MIAINVQGLLYTTRAALPHLLKSAEGGPPACVFIRRGRVSAVPWQERAS